MCTNRGTACVLLFFPFSCNKFVSWTSCHSPVCCSCFSFSSDSFSSVCHRIFTFFQTVQLLLCSAFFTFTAALHPWSYRFVCDTRATHCPRQLKTGSVSPRHTQMSMMHIPWFTSNLMTVLSRLFRVRGFFSSSTTTLPACTTLLIEIRASQRSHS